MRNKSVIIFLALVIFVCCMLVFAPFAKAHTQLDKQIREERIPRIYYPEIVGEPTKFTSPKKFASDEDVDLLARILYLEAGSNWIDDWVIEYCGSVIINRINHWYYPETLYGVLSQRGQFACWGAQYSITPSERCYRIARELLEDGSKLPEDIVYFAGFRQGSYVYEVFWNPGPGDNLYFCGF